MPRVSIIDPQPGKIADKFHFDFGITSDKFSV